MRWFWLDRFEELVSGSHAVAVKNVSLSEEHIHDHFPGYPVMPTSLMLEGMAQIGGILLGEKFDFSHMVVLAKVTKVEFFGEAIPGDQIVYRAELLDAHHDGGMANVQASVKDELIAKAEICFAHMDSADPSVMEKFDKSNFVFTTQGLMSILEVGK